ncbi:metacaspase-1 isoform X2 [Populus trichocarpa]|uniref:metacaspase-1 isoform X2 n=1 Tax=Populus trichocarpa TaxID=3694 RepID=UPI00227991BB|nr:metacaspase-1 isoform X2 [Populus trichocarpa]
MSGNNHIMMVTRGVVCGKCRHRLSIPTTNSTEVKCPTCNKMNPIPTYEQFGNKDRSIEKLIVKAKEKISGNDLISSKKPDSLNKKPCPLNIPGSSSSETRPAGKRALLIGVTYKRKHKLKGTINDVKSMRELLTLNFGFKEENILVLTEQEIEPELIPTKKNILKSLEWLVKGCQAGDSLVFYFSGHGLSQPDFEGDERDGFAENICPVDFMTEGMIVDNDINSTIVWPLKKGVTLHAIVDACHSGTVLDLEHVYNRQEKHPDGGLAISLSACLDNQVAADTTAFTGKTMNGAMTFLLIKILKKYHGATYGDLLDMMHEELEKVNESRCFAEKILKKITKNMLLQKPQISASKPFDVYKEHFVL